MSAKATDSKDFSEPVLPPELLLKIFEIAYRDSPGDALRLMLTGKCVHEWILPLIYHSMVFEEESGSAKFQRFASIHLSHCHSDSPDTLLSRYTRRVSFKIHVRGLPDTHRFFLACSNLVELHYWPNTRRNDPATACAVMKNVMKVIAKMPLERLSLHFDPGNLFGSDVSAIAMSHTLTHLDLHSWDCPPSHLVHLRSLTHFAVTFNHVNANNMITTTIPSLLKRNAPDYTPMKIIVVQLVTKVALGNDLVHDKRVVEMSDAYNIGTKDRYGMPDFWERAEERVSKISDN